MNDNASSTTKTLFSHVFLTLPENLPKQNLCFCCLLLLTENSLFTLSFDTYKKDYNIDPKDGSRNKKICGSAVKSNGFSYRGCRFKSQLPHGSLQWSLTLVPGDLMSSSGLF